MYRTDHPLSPLSISQDTAPGSAQYLPVAVCNLYKILYILPFLAPFFQFEPFQLSILPFKWGSYVAKYHDGVRMMLPLLLDKSLSLQLLGC
jgi:hypothetical protein